MAQIICTELGVYDDASLLMCAVFLSRQYVNLWDKYPWGDTMGTGRAQILAGISVVDYPVGMDRITTLRVSTGAVGTPPEEPTNPIDEIEPPTTPDEVDALAPVPLNSYFLDPVDATFLIESEPTIFEDRGWLLKYYEEIGNAANRQIRLYPIPIWGTTLFFYGKLICPGLVADTDASVIRNIDNALIAYATARFLRRQRQFGKAEIQEKKGAEEEAQAWNLEQQQANQPRRTKATTVAGNSLAEMTDAVCQVCGQWTPEYRQVIREFLRRNYQTMYDTFLWPESLVMVRVPYVTEQVVLPPYIDKVLGPTLSEGDIVVMSGDEIAGPAILFAVNAFITLLRDHVMSNIRQMAGHESVKN
jgi:hypothetical protein